jgi:osmotically-inducible protein OsmY
MASLLAQSHEDLRLAEHVERILHETGRGPLREIEVTVRDRVVVLAGRVPTYYLKQLAQAAAQAVPGIDQIHNDLEVL